MNKFKKTFNLLPIKFKYKSIYFVIFLITATFLETIGIGVVFPLLEIVVNGDTSENIFSKGLKNIFNENIQIKSLITFILILYFFKTIYLIYFNYWQQKFSQNIFKALSLKLFQYYLSSSLKFYYTKNSSELLRNTLNECKNYGTLISISLRLFVEILIASFLFCLAFYIEPITTLLVSFIIIILIFLYYLLTKKKIYSYGLDRINKTQNQIKILLESFSGIRDIKLKSSENFFLNLYNKATEKFISAAYKQQTIIEAPRYLFEFLFLSALLFGLLIFMKFNQDINSILPILGLYVVISFKLVPGLMKILNILQQIKGLEPTLNVLSEELSNLNVKKKIIEKDSIQNIKFMENISLSKVSFSYERKKIFNSFSENIKKNSFVGIIGKSGSGKSTLIDLLTGLIVPNSGEIKVDDISIHKNIKDWQKKIGYVSQNSFLLDASIIENVAFGEERDKINLDKVKKALKDAQILDYVENLDKSLDTLIGENGLQLSGGQRQRISIARELYRDPEFLILDEATNALDEETENQFLEFLDNLKGKVTVLISSHRKNSFKKCDKIITLTEEDSA